MKLFIAFFALVAVANAGLTSEEHSRLAGLIASIIHPSTPSSTASLLQAQLLQLLGIPPVSVGPAIVDFPLPDGGAVTEQKPTPGPKPPKPTPLVVGPSPAAAAAASPFVQIIVNVNANSAPSPAPVVAPEKPVDEVIVVDKPVLPAPEEPVLPGPVEPSPEEPIELEPILVGVPVLPEPIVPIVMPDPLN